MSASVAAAGQPRSDRQALSQGVFVAVWAVVTLIKVVIAAHLPLFVDEAFYWQEGRHLAAAYSDLPGLTAWLTWLGTAIGGQHVLALRAPFLLLGAVLPWLMVATARRWFGAHAGWQAGSLTVLLPLAGTLGILAVPDVPMVFATALCLHAGARLLEEVDAAGALQLALGLVVGALSHYRFLAVIGVGLVALLLLPRGRALLRDPRVLIALALGVVAWTPLVAWNTAHAEAGLRFQLVDRHPWRFHIDGLLFVLVQAALVTPPLFVALAQVFWRSVRGRGLPVQWRYFGLLGGVSTLGWFVLGFFADSERVSFHWPLPGYLALLLAVPALLRSWPVLAQRATWALAGLGLAGVLGFYLVAAVPQWRAATAADKWYPANFAGWDLLAQAVREEQARHPDRQLLADNFKIGAELGFALDRPDIAVLDHPLNHKHGRAPQLRLWGLQRDAHPPGPQLLVVGEGDVSYRLRLDYYHALCARLGPLPPPRIVSVDHGRQRFALFDLPGRAPQADGGPEPACTAPAFAWVDVPVSAAVVPARFEVDGWAFKDGVGLSAVEVLVDGRVVAAAQYGLDNPGVARYWRISNDPNQPRVGFRAALDLHGMRAGRHWLGLRLHGRDGSVEDWAEQPIQLQK